MHGSTRQVLLSPVGHAVLEEPVPIAPRETNGRGLRLCLIDNSRPGSDLLLESLAERLKSRMDIVDVRMLRKEQSGVVAPWLGDVQAEVVILGIAELGGSLFGSVRDAVELERAGIPVALLCSSDVAPACRRMLATSGLPSLPIVEVSPTSELPRDELENRSAEVVEAVLRVLTGPRDELMRVASELAHAALEHEERDLGPETIECEDTLSGAQAAAAKMRGLGWTDGLPVNLPTGEAVEAMVRAARRPPGVVVGCIPPRHGAATIEKIAVNAVMAGCTPILMPLVIAATEAVLDPAFRLGSLQTTANPCTTMVIVNGPAADVLRMNSGSNAFGPGNFSNAAIGRALRMLLVNIGGARAGIEDAAVQGTPAKFLFAVAENEAASPWEPLHVERGFPRDANAVTVVGAESPHNINDHVHETATGILGTVSDSMSTIATNNLYKHDAEVVVALAPYHARQIASQGWSKSDVKRFLFEHARRSLSDVRRGGTWGMTSWAPWIDKEDEGTRIPIVGEWRDIIVIVVGGRGKHSSWMPTFGVTRACTRAFEVEGAQ